MKYIVACHIDNRHLFSESNPNMQKTIQYLQAVYPKWYLHDVFAPVIPFQKRWERRHYLFWWDLIDVPPRKGVQDVIYGLEDMIMKKDKHSQMLTSDDVVDIHDIISWVEHWASQGAYFMLLNV